MAPQWGGWRCRRQDPRPADRQTEPGSRVYIPPNAVHSLVAASDHAPIWCFCFAIACPDAGEINYTAH